MAAASDGQDFVAQPADPRIPVHGNAWHSTIGQMLGDLSDAVFLADPVQEGCPILWASRELCQLSGFPSEELVGKNWDVLLDGVPEQYVSRSAHQNFQDWIQACRTAGLFRIAEVSSVQPNKRQNESLFVSFLLFGLCQVHGRPCILGVSLCLGEGSSVKTTKSQIAQVSQDARSVLQRTRGLLSSRSASKPSWSPLEGAAPEFGFYADRLQDHCMLLGGGFSAVRREAAKIPRGCLLYGSRPVKCKAGQGLAFDLRVDRVSEAFSGFPVLGFTQRRPVDAPDLYPSASKCLGASALIGGLGTASVRQQEVHFPIGFKPPPAAEVSESSAWLLAEGAVGSTEFFAGDVLRCTYSESGRLEFWRNGELILARSTGQPLDPKAEYYAVVDVCLAAEAVTLLPSRSADVEDNASTVTTRIQTSSPLSSQSLESEAWSDAAADAPPELPSRSASVAGRAKTPSMCPSFLRKRPRAASVTGHIRQASGIFRRSFGA